MDLLKKKDVLLSLDRADGAGEVTLTSVRPNSSTSGIISEVVEYLFGAEIDFDLDRKILRTVEKEDGFGEVVGRPMLRVLLGNLNNQKKKNQTTAPKFPKVGLVLTFHHQQSWEDSCFEYLRSLPNQPFFRLIFSPS